jgi:hypothetical protein
MPAAMAQSQVTPQQQNMMARQAVIRQGVDMWLPIFAQSYSAANGQGPGTIINVPLRNVGLIKRLLIRVNAQLTNTAALQRTYIGGSAFFSNVTFNDLSNQQRISTTGWHLTAVASAKRRRPFGSAAALDEPSLAEQAATPGIRSSFAMGYGNTHSNAFYCPYTIALNVNPLIALAFEVPFSYTDHDLRGAIYANVTNATMNVQMTVNPQLFNVTGARAAQHGMFTSATVPTLTSFTIEIYQNFLDQLPIAQQGGPILPLLDLSTAYLLNNTAVSGVVANQDNPIPYANFRDFMSTCVIYDDPSVGPQAPGGQGASSMNYWSLQSANYTNIFKLAPGANTLLSRLVIGDDFPFPLSYFDFRNKPVSTIQYGNMQLIANPVTVTDSQTAFLVGFESLALINMITQAGSLYGS